MEPSRRMKDFQFAASVSRRGTLLVRVLSGELIPKRCYTNLHLLLKDAGCCTCGYNASCTYFVFIHIYLLHRNHISANVFELPIWQTRSKPFSTTIRPSSTDRLRRTTNFQRTARSLQGDREISKNPAHMQSPQLFLKHIPKLEPPMHQPSCNRALDWTAKSAKCYSTLISNQGNAPKLPGTASSAARDCTGLLSPVLSLKVVLAGPLSTMTSMEAPASPCPAARGHNFRKL